MVKKKSVKGILRPKCLENPWPRLGLKELNSGSKENGIHEEQDQEPQDLFAGKYRLKT